ncbi:hypothetical protein DL93DRAFT_2172589 [Clavulina sp. PMI_390]|nr:hypothetical protein DL93DRAFT_2172589 [Clavulina sp. PMI_390]
MLRRDPSVITISDKDVEDMRQRAREFEAKRQLAERQRNAIAGSSAGAVDAEAPPTTAGGSLNGILSGSGANFGAGSHTYGFRRYCVQPDSMAYQVLIPTSRPL